MQATGVFFFCLDRWKGGTAVGNSAPNWFHVWEFSPLLCPNNIRFQIFIGELCADTTMIVSLPPLWLGFLHELYRLPDGGF